MQGYWSELYICYKCRWQFKCLSWKIFCPVQINTWLKTLLQIHKQIVICPSIKLSFPSRHSNATKANRAYKVFKLCAWMHCSFLWLLLLFIYLFCPSWLSMSLFEIIFLLYLYIKSGVNSYLLELPYNYCSFITGIWLRKLQTYTLRDFFSTAV